MLNRNNFLECSYDELIKFADYRINRLKITTVNSEDLVHIVLCKILEHNRKHLLNKAYLIQAINNVSLNIKRKDCAKYTPSLKPIEVLEYLAEDTKTVLDELLAEESYLFNKENEKILFSIIQGYLNETNASNTIRQLLDPGSETFFPLFKTSELADRLGLSPSTVTNNLSRIRQEILPEIKKRYKLCIEQNKLAYNYQGRLSAKTPLEYAYL